MPPALQVLNFYSTSLTGGSFEALTAGTGDSATIQTTSQEPAGYLSSIYGTDDTSVCEISITATRFHDQTYGIRMALPAGSGLAPAGRSLEISPLGIKQAVYSADVLSVKANGTAADNVNVTFMIYYPNLAGIDFNGITADQLRNLGGNNVGVRVSPTSGSGDWGSSVALNSVTDLLHAGKDYALVGASSQTPVAAFGIQGIDSGNMRVGGPLLADPGLDATLFLRHAEAHNAALIPVFQANNAGAINIYAAHTTGAAEAIDLYFVELSQKVIQ